MRVFQLWMWTIGGYKSINGVHWVSNENCGGKQNFLECFGLKVLWAVVFDIHNLFIIQRGYLERLWNAFQNIRKFEIDFLIKFFQSQKSCSTDVFFSTSKSLSLVTVSRARVPLFPCFVDLNIRISYLQQVHIIRVRNFLQILRNYLAIK